MEHWETYQNLYLSLIASGTTLLVSYSIFGMTKKKDNKQEMSKLYGELIYDRQELESSYRKLVYDQIEFYCAHSCATLLKTLYYIEESEKTLKQFDESLVNFEKASTTFESKIGIYICSKGDNTSVTEIKQILNDEFSFDIMDFSKKFKNEDAIYKFAEKQRDAFLSYTLKKFKPSLLLLECVTTNS